MNDNDDPIEVTTYGLLWGQLTVSCLTSIHWRKRDKRSSKVIQVNDLEIYVSPTGRTRVFRKHQELKSVSSR